MLSIPDKRQQGLAGVNSDGLIAKLLRQAARHGDQDAWQLAQVGVWLTVRCLGLNRYGPAIYRPAQTTGSTIYNLC